MVENLSVGDHIHDSQIRFRKINDFENYVNATD